MEQTLLASPYFYLIFYLIIAWTIPWKGVALWRAAKNSHKKWFVALLILNTLAILEIVYIFYFAKKSKARNPKSETNLNN